MSWAEMMTQTGAGSCLALALGVLAVWIVAKGDGRR